MKNPILFSAFLLFTLNSSAFAVEKLRQLTGYHQIEKTVINCLYPSLLQSDLSQKQINSSFSPPNSSTCQQAYSQYNQLIGSLSTPQSAFPNALTALQITLNQQVRVRWAPEIKSEVPMLTTYVRPNAFELGFNVWETEKKLRESVGLGKQPKHCTQSPEHLDLHSQNELFKKMLTQGMNCVIRDFKASSLLANGLAGLPDAQQRFDKLVSQQQNKVGLADNQFLRGYWILHFPQLGYELTELPLQGQLEKLDISSLRGNIENKGGKFVLIERVTVDHLKNQVQASLIQLQKLLASEEYRRTNPKLLITARSMGALIVKELLSQDPYLRQKIAGVLLLGATPWGSVIAEYRSRADVFDENFAQLMNPIYQGVFKLTGHFNPRLLQVRDAALKLKNIESMSHLGQRPRRLDWNLPVTNVILLPDHIENFFGDSQRIAGVDVTMFLTSHYGPTEGSSPLAGAGLDTQRSTRVFEKRYNHLAFWELEKEPALDLWNASLQLLIEQIRTRR